MERCKCGSTAELEESSSFKMRFECSNLCGICGPFRTTEGAAESAWNELMSVQLAPVEKALRMPFHMVATDTALYVLCSDGAVFIKSMTDTIGSDWDVMTSIPGTPADIASAKGEK